MCTSQQLTRIGRHKPLAWLYTGVSAEPQRSQAIPPRLTQPGSGTIWTQIPELWILSLYEVVSGSGPVIAYRILRTLNPWPNPLLLIKAFAPDPCPKTCWVFVASGSVCSELKNWDECSDSILTMCACACTWRQYFLHLLPIFNLCSPY